LKRYTQVTVLNVSAVVDFCYNESGEVTGLETITTTTLLVEVFDDHSELTIGLSAAATILGFQGGLFGALAFWAGPLAPGCIALSIISEVAAAALGGAAAVNAGLPPTLISSDVVETISRTYTPMKPGSGITAGP
jgi:hypothetical protein